MHLPTAEQTPTQYNRAKRAQVHVYMTPEMREAVQEAALKRPTTMQGYIEEAVREKLATDGYESRPVPDGRTMASAAS
jgi:hypothetical protein